MAIKNLNTHAQAIANKIDTDKSMSVNADGSSAVSDDQFSNNLPEGLTNESYKAHDEHRTNYNAAVHYAGGLMAVHAMAANRDINRVSFDVPMGHKDSLHIDVMGEVELPDGKGSDFGVVTSVYSMHASGVAGAQMKIAMSHVREAAKSALEKETT